MDGRFVQREQKTKHQTKCKDTPKFWKTCPKRDGSLDSFILSTYGKRDITLGNQVWAYVSIWALAKRYGVRPAIPDSTLNALSRMFDHEHFSIQSLHAVGVRCSLLPWLLDEHEHGGLVIGAPKDMIEKLQSDADQDLTLMMYDVTVAYAFNTVPLWGDLTEDLVIRKDLRDEAQTRLRHIKNEYLNLRIDVSQNDIEFVSVHVSRPKYQAYIKSIYKDMINVNEYFYLNAFEWMKRKVRKVLIFIILTKDIAWAEDNLVQDQKEVVVPGYQVHNNEYQDLALMAACNHSIFAYGLYGLTGALLAPRSGYTIVYDIGRKEFTKEMQFASSLPRWYIMDNRGRLQYENEIIDLNSGAL